jgi:hypothetical protein
MASLDVLNIKQHLLNKYYKTLHKNELERNRIGYPKQQGMRIPGGILK